MEPWLRGPLPGIPPLLQPAGHAFIAAREEVESAVAGLGDAAIWQSPGEAAPIGFHLLHLTGSTDRLLTYARGESLSEVQRAALKAEETLTPPLPNLEALTAGWHTAVDLALIQLGSTAEASLRETRYVGRARVPTTVLGLLFHAAEHARRHAGQVVTTARIIRSMTSS